MSSVDICENWKFIKFASSAQDAAIRAVMPEAETVSLPHTWNAVDGQDGGNDYYRGKCWYVRALQAEEIPLYENGRVYLEFEGAAYTAEVYVNGACKCHHENGFSTFRIDITEELLKTETLEIVVSCENGDSDRVYPQQADFTFYGGLYRAVRVLSLPLVHFDRDYFGSCGLKVTPLLDLDLGYADVTLETWVKQGTSAAFGQKVCFQIMDGEGQAILKEEVRTDESGHAICTVRIENARRWEGIKDPYLYTVVAALADETLSEKFGCRTFDIDPQKGFLLNGHPYPLRGVSMHQDIKGMGNAITKAVLDQNMAFVREIGANTLRLAHYQHAQYFYDLCDREGIVVWTEIPFITMFMPKGRECTLQMMRELIAQNYNHASIAVWGLSNEITAASVVNEELLDNHRALNDLAHSMDPTRKTTMANVFMLETDSPLLEVPDVNSYNLYFGWYVGELEEADHFFDAFHRDHPQMAIGYSEYGADANPAYQAEDPVRSDYTEGYQALYHEHNLAMIQARPWLWATHVWNLFDFAADGRDEGGRHGENQKGLVTFDRSYRKDAFYLYKAAWNKREPFVHLCGKKYENRESDETKITVYSNQPRVALYVNGNKVAEQRGNTVFHFVIPNVGSQWIAARGFGDIEGGAACGQPTVDGMRIHKVDGKDADYIFNSSLGSVDNWFDAEEIDPDFWSVWDKLGEIREDPQAGAVVNTMMEQASASRGDVADSVKDNPALQKMLGRMTMVSLLKQGGVGEEAVKQLNRVLQGIPKKKS